MRRLRPYRNLRLYVLLLLPTLCRAQGDPALPAVAHNDPQSLRAVAVATTFMNDIIHDSAVTTLAGLCSLPFCYDDTVIVLTRDELGKSLSKLLVASATAAKRTNPSVDSAYVLDIRKEVLFGMVPINCRPAKIQCPGKTSRQIADPGGPTFRRSQSCRYTRLTVNRGSLKQLPLFRQKIPNFVYN
jgi:hypothetical protein